ncbi:DsbE family thiol:disulfide interchange protein [uncultured Pseudoteredinibacter sp.]|uniref:DsbE family thiol:disulfide interchange protein n=1 Tax=uncultured Pseudoteredinibacter sp. TaxID=1641701 RepID=UPI00262D764C|nr:DsbE family thiol:disulfide interchange protein [uncultured Pseudoteredinibacter sp.]
MARLKLFVPLAIFVALAALLWKGLSLDPTAMPSALKDKAFPQFSLPILKDEQQLKNQSDLKGQVTLVNVWATWCVVCRVEHPYLLELAEQGVRIVGVNYKDQPDAARQWLKDLKDPYAFSVMDRDGRLGLDLGVFGAPESYLVDQQGFIRHKHVGVVDDKVWARDFLPIIEQLNTK